jgi:hypothetical protein
MDFLDNQTGLEPATRRALTAAPNTRVGVKLTAPLSCSLWVAHCATTWNVDTWIWCTNTFKKKNVHIHICIPEASSLKVSPRSYYFVLTSWFVVIRQITYLQDFQLYSWIERRYFYTRVHKLWSRTPTEEIRFFQGHIFFARKLFHRIGPWKCSWRHFLRPWCRAQPVISSMPKFTYNPTCKKRRLVRNSLVSEAQAHLGDKFRSWTKWEKKVQRNTRTIFFPTLLNELA